MAITLNEIRKTTPDALDMKVIDELRAKSFLMDKLPFVETGIPGGVGASLAYTYNRVITPSGAAFRDFNEEYDVSNATVEPQTVHLKPFGGVFGIDRAFTDIGWIDRVTFEISQKINSAVKAFNNATINGDSAVDSKMFDGLDKALTGSTTENTVSIDLSTESAIKTNASTFVSAMSDTMDSLDATPTAILTNRTTLGKIKAVAREKGMYQLTKTDLGTRLESFDGVPLVDMGDLPGSAKPVVGIDDTAGTTDIYFVRIGQDGFHALKKTGQLIKTVLPNPDITAKSVVYGSVEIVSATALKATRAAGVLRGIKVKPGV